jgi:TfoX/Sxy family transcriptional regulator of competence genes
VVATGITTVSARLTVATPDDAGYQDTMAYDDDLAGRIRELISAEHGVEERRMFGGLAFLINGNMAVAASGRGGLMVRVPRDDTEKLAARDHIGPMTMAGREIRGWLTVSSDGVRTKRQLQSWVRRGIDYAKSLPPK